MAARFVVILAAIQLFTMFGCSSADSHQEAIEIGPKIKADTAYARRLVQRAEYLAKEARYDSAAIYFELASNHYEAVQDWSGVVRCDAGKAGCLINLGQFDQARGILNHALDIASTQLDDSDPVLGDAFTSLGRLHIKEHSYERALEAHKKALDIRVLAFGDEHPDVAESYVGLAIACLFTGDYQRAERFFNEALGILRNVWGEEHSDVAAVYTDLGYLYTETGKYDLAVEILEPALRINRSMLGRRHPAVAETLKNLGEAYRLRGDYTQALEAHQKALEIADRAFGEKQHLVAAILNNLGIVHVEIGNPEAAIPFYERSLSIRQALGGADDPALTNNFNNLGVAYMRIGDYDRALRYLQSGLRMRREQFGENNRNVAIYLNNIGTVFSRRGEYNQARGYYEKALRAFIAAVGEQHPYVANQYKVLGGIMNVLGAHGEALTNLEKALLIFQSTTGEQDPYVSSAYHLLGTTYDSLGLSALALDFHYKALSHRTDKYGEHHPLVATHYNEIGNIYGRQASFERALDNYDKALIANHAHKRERSAPNTPSSNNSLSDPIWLQSLWGRARTLSSRGAVRGNFVPDLEAAHDTYYQAAQTLDRMQRRYRNQSSRLHWGEVVAPLMADAVDVSFALYKATDDERHKAAAFYFAEKSKGNVLLAALSDARARRFAGIPDSLLRQERMLLASLISTEQRLLNARTGAHESASTDIARLEQDAFTFTQQHAALIDHFEHSYPNYYKLKYEVEVATPERVQAAGLDDETVLVEYMIGDKKIFIFTLSTRDFDVIAVPRNPGLERQVEDLRRGIVEQNYETYTTNARALYVQLLEPVIHSLEARKLLIVPDGVLNYIPFESLLSETPNYASPNDYSRLPYLINRYAVSYAYSSTLLLETRNRERAEPDRDFVAFAPVSLGGLPAGSAGAGLVEKYASTGAVHSAGWGYLPMTHVEVTQIKNLFSRAYTLFDRLFSDKARVYLGERALESQVMSDEVSRYRYVHFATHGFADPASPESSGIVLFSTSAGADSTSLTEDEPSWSDDGVLRLDEVYALRLNADVVVLSACETGLGPVARGEGILSLARGFLYAGASNVVASLWKADDLQTQKLMLGFYRNMLDGTATSSSLRAAKLDLIRGNTRYARPYYWATFVLIGA